MGVEVAPRAAARWARNRRREEERWRDLNGPVVVTNLRDRNREILPNDREILPSHDADTQD